MLLLPSSVAFGGSLLLLLLLPLLALLPQASTVTADPLTKFLEVCHVAQPDADIPTNMMTNPWTPRLK
jgi:hypothetical protein